MVETLIGLSALFVGTIIGWYSTRTRASALIVKQNQLTDELEKMRRQALDKAHEWTQSLNQKSHQHADDVAKLRDESRSIADAREDDWRQKFRLSEEKAYAEGFRQAELKHDRIDKAFTVKVRPFVRKETKSGFFGGDNLLQIGYQYQLYVLDVPCFQAHQVIDSTHKEKQFNDERMKWAVDKAIEVAALVVSAKTGLPITLDRTEVIEG